MKIYFSQIYIAAGINYPFSFHFQRWLSERVSTLTEPSVRFLEKYGPDWKLIFRVSAKADIGAVEVRGPTKFRKDRDVEYTIFLPHPGKPVTAHSECEQALKHLLEGVRQALGSLEIDTHDLQVSEAGLTEELSANPEFIEWDD